MLLPLTGISTETLIDMLTLILASERTLTSTDVTELEWIQRELQRRARDESWNSQVLN